MGWQIAGESAAISPIVHPRDADAAAARPHAALLLGAPALALTLVGVYGLAACLVARHTKEIGVRMALGAGALELARVLLHHTVLPIAAGLLLGAGAAWYGGAFADRFMYGMRGSAPATLAIAVVTIVVCGALAVALPLRRALRIDPIETLRAE